MVSRETLQGIEPRQVTAWLRSNGWTHIEDSAGAVLYRKPAQESDEGDYEVAVPEHSGFRDYMLRIREVISTISVAAARPQDWIAREVRNSTADIIRLRAVGPGVGPGVVPVELGTRLIKGAADLVLAAACAAVEPRPVYRTRKPQEAVEFVNTVRLGAAEEGSFVVTLHAPVPPALQPASSEELETEPFERRSTLMLAESVVAARHAAERAGLGEGMQPFHAATARGVSANLCEALAQLVTGDDVSELELLFGWAASRPVAQGVARQIRLGSDTGAVLKEAARQLRATAPTPDFALEGFVVRLESDSPAQGGTAVVAVVVDGRPLKVRVGMRAEDYNKAIAAHQDSNLIRCEGELTRVAKSYVLESVRHVEVVVVPDEVP